jgi:hypothetical protein
MGKDLLAQAGFSLFALLEPEPASEEVAEELDELDPESELDESLDELADEPSPSDDFPSPLLRAAAVLLSA